MNLLNKIFLGLLINLATVSVSHAQTVSDNSYADNLALSCSYAKEHLRYIDEKVKQYLNKSISKEEITESLNVIVEKWEAIRINNECFTIGAKISSCTEGKNKANEVVVANGILNLIRNLTSDIETKTNNIITDQLQKSLVITQSLIKKNCPN